MATETSRRCTAGEALGRRRRPALHLGSCECPQLSLLCERIPLSVCLFSPLSAHDCWCLWRKRPTGRLRSWVLISGRLTVPTVLRPGELLFSGRVLLFC